MSEVSDASSPHKLGESERQVVQVQEKSTLQDIRHCRQAVKEMAIIHSAIDTTLDAMLAPAQTADD